MRDSYDNISFSNNKDYMKDQITCEELDISLQIMDTMSYSVVKKNGFTNLGT